MTERSHTCGRKDDACSIFSASNCDRCVERLMAAGADSGWTIESMAAACTTWEKRQQIPVEASEYDEPSPEQLARVRSIVEVTET